MSHQSHKDGFKLRISILHKLMLHVIILVFIAMGISTYLSVKMQTKVLTEGLIHTGKHMATHIASSTKSAFWSLNWIFVEKILKEIKQNSKDEVIFTKVVKPNGEVYLANEKVYYGETVDPSLLYAHETLLDNYFYPATKEHGYLLVHPIIIGKDRWYVILGLSLRSIREATKALIVRNVAWGGFILLLAVIGSFFLSKSISRPIISLAKSAKLISGGNWDHKVMAKSKDEVGLLSHSFSRMIEKLKAASAELEASEQRYRTLIATASKAKIGIAVIQNDQDRKGVLKYVNQGVADMTGCTREELLKKTIKNIIHPDNLNDVWKIFTEGLLENESSRTYQFWGINKKGEKVPIEISTGVTEFDGKRALVCYAKDITEKLEADEKLKNYSQNLERMVEERTCELKETQKELVNKAMEAGRVQLSAMVLHNIGNAITPIKVQIEGMKSSELDQKSNYLKKCYLDLNEHSRDLHHYVNDDPRGKEVFSYMGKLVNSIGEYCQQKKSFISRIDGAVSYISEILTLQQAYAASEQETKEHTDLNTIVEDAMRMQAGALEKRGIIVKKKLVQNLPKLLIDKNRLMQVFVNFIKNSYEAIDELEDDNKEKVIAFKSSAEDGRVRLEITDSGIGIEPEFIDKIFEFGESRKGSSGFGLYYCKMFVEANKGALDISSPGIGKGANVSVSLPAMTERLLGLEP